MLWIRRDHEANALKHIGEVYGFVKIVGVSEMRTKTKERLYVCECLRCNEGVTFLSRLHPLRSGNTKSCGCYRIDHCNEIRKRRGKDNEESKG